MYLLQYTDSEHHKRSGGKAAGLGLAHKLGFKIPLTLIILPNTDMTDRLNIEIARMVIGQYPDIKFAVRSSANVEDSVAGSFAGMFDTMLDVERDNLKEAIEIVRHVPARAMSYAAQMGIVLPETIPVLVQCMVQHNQGAGVFLSHNVTQNRPSDCLLEMVVNERGEALVSGTQSPDITAVWERWTEPPKVLGTYRGLAGMVNLALKSVSYPFDIEFACENMNTILLQLRPIAAAALSDEALRGQVVYGEGQITGRVFRADPLAVQQQVCPVGNILVTRHTTPDLIESMLAAKAVVTEVGGYTQHAAIVCSELHKPCLIGVGALSRFNTGDIITLDFATHTVSRVEEA